MPVPVTGIWVAASLVYLAAGLLGLLGVPGMGTVQVAAVALVAVILLTAVGSRVARLAARRISRPEPRGASEEFRQGLRRAAGSLVTSGAIPGLVGGATSLPGAPSPAVLPAEAGRRLTAAWGSPASLDADTVLEVGSITKVITGTLLAALCLDGVIGLETDVADVLGLPRLRGVTFTDLATHRSGLPRLPRGMRLRALRADPYRGIDARGLLASVPVPGPHTPAYSNLGFALLGLALARAGGRDYASLAAERILDPLGMSASGFTISPGVRGHDALGLPAARWRLGAYAPAGGLRAPVHDLLVLADAVLSAPAGPLGPAFMLATTARAPGLTGQGSIGLGWMIRGDGVVWHNGGTGGMDSWLGIDRARRQASALVATRSSRRGVDAAGWRLLHDRSAGARTG